MTANCIARGTEMLAIMKSIWTAAIPAYLKRIEYAALHTQMKTEAQPVFRKGNISDEFRERRMGAPEFMADRIIL